MYQKALTLRIIGFVTSLLLTLAAYLIIVHPEIVHLQIATAITVILFLAFIQASVQVIFFLDIWDEEGPPWNLAVFVSTLSIIFIIVFFSIWIMHHLNYNMMPMMS